ncbi:MAG: hypothetical protein MZU97_09715 [Bacillus subtilis]|nr:hypothetical protein [Bacillus subtilis]
MSAGSISRNDCDTIEDERRKRKEEYDGRIVGDSGHRRCHREETRRSRHRHPRQARAHLPGPLRPPFHRLRRAGADRRDPSRSAASSPRRLPSPIIRKRLTRLSVDVRCDGISVRITAFNREFLRAALAEAAEIVATGRFEPDRRHFLASEIVLAKNYREGIVPVYGLDGLSDRLFAKFVAAALPLAPEAARETLPARLLASRKIAPLKETLAYVHAPKSEAEIAAASGRVKYEELLALRTRREMQRRKNDAVSTDSQEIRHRTGARLHPDAAVRTDRRPEGQATNEIFADLKKPRRMLRLLQGDVGGGKTVCAAIAAYAIHTAGEQSRLHGADGHPRPPARRDPRTPFRAVRASGVAYLSGAVKGAERTAILDGARRPARMHVVVRHARADPGAGRVPASRLRRRSTSSTASASRSGRSCARRADDPARPRRCRPRRSRARSRSPSTATWTSRRSARCRPGRKPIRTDVADFADFKRHRRARRAARSRRVGRPT